MISLTSFPPIEAAPVQDRFKTYPNAAIASKAAARLVSVRRHERTSVRDRLAGKYNADGGTLTLIRPTT